MKDLLIIGAGSVGQHIAVNYAAYGLPYELVGFLDDDPGKAGQDYYGCPVLGPVDTVREYATVAVVLGIGFPRIKQEIFERIADHPDIEFPTFVSPRAWISAGVRIGRGSIIYPGCSINYGTEVGDFVMMNMNCAIGHDCRLGDFSNYAPGVNLGGHTRIGRAVDMGIGAATKQFISIGDETIVGGQSMVIRDVGPADKVAGVPACSLLK